MLSIFLLAFLLSSKYILIVWLRSSSAVILEPKKIKSVTFSIVYLSIDYEVMGRDDMILGFLMLSFKPVFFFFPKSLSFFTFIKFLQFLFTFCHEGDAICVSEIIGISPGSLDCSLWFIQPGISHDVHCMQVK